MGYWIFVAAKRTSGDNIINPMYTYDTRMNDAFWGLGESTPNRKLLRENDFVIFYVGTPDKIFAGSAKLDSDSFELTSDQTRDLSHGEEFFTTQYGVKLKDIQRWIPAKPITNYIPSLNFIENKQNWGVYFQGGVRQISQDDYELIVGQNLNLSFNPSPSIHDINIQAEFALEFHLEEFMHKNWDSIKWGRKLILYTTTDNNGRQFPAGQWSIDFLAKDPLTNNLVVIELKKGKTSDAVIGQTLRYIEWVKENIAKDGQKVEGLIISQDTDNALKYALRGVPTIKAFNYKIDFTLVQHTENT
ncbi:MAG TPA: hypothetical protein VFO76_02940 [Candidatus Kapabacteria bacterium]|nr:hypothetical protein [Candidatus Kapabacteria bacterium]